MTNLLKKIFGFDFLENFGEATRSRAGENKMAVFIKETGSGFGIFSREGGKMVPTDYSRRRDAIRGATRRGFTVASV
jgi:hypothetical protein